MLRFFGLMLFAFCCFATVARAETYRLSYDVAVLGVVVLGTASYDVTANESAYGVRANVRTSGLTRMFDQTEINATTAGAVSGANLAWSRYDLSHAYSGKFRRIGLVRGENGVDASITPRYGDMGQPPASAAQRRSAYDPLTAVFALGRQVGAARACRGEALVFDGRQHYRLSLSGGTQGSSSDGGYSGASLTCAFRYEPIAGFNMAAAERARIPAGELEFALPQGAIFAPPLRLSVPTPVGSATVRLSAYQRTA